MPHELRFPTPHECFSCGIKFYRTSPEPGLAGELVVNYESTEFCSLECEQEHDAQIKLGNDLVAQAEALMAMSKEQVMSLNDARLKREVPQVFPNPLRIKTI